MYFVLPIPNYCTFVLYICIKNKIPRINCGCCTHHLQYLDAPPAVLAPPALRPARTTSGTVG